MNRVAVLAPSPYLTVTIESAPNGDDEVHLHAGGQGFWVARLATELGADVTLCTALGGESGDVVGHLLGLQPIELVATNGGANGVYVHDRRGGERREVGDAPPHALDRHAVDDLYGAALAAAVDADVFAITGTNPADVLPDGFFERLIGDVGRAGTMTVADLSGEQLAEALRAGLDVLKVSEEELRRDGLLTDGDDDVVAAARRVQERGAKAVVVTRAAEGTVVVDDDVTEVHAPRVEAVDPAGAGDSLTGAVAAVLAKGGTLAEAVQLGTAAAALNVTRRGLGSGRRADIERFAAGVATRSVA
jgi:1-phosphofructokinase